jgi:predicted amidohydrolase YtcJ
MSAIPKYPGDTWRRTDSFSETLTMPRFRPVLIVSAFVSGATQLHAQEPVDTVLFNGKIVTVDETFSIAEAVAIRGERISAVGSDDAYRVPPLRMVQDSGIPWGLGTDGTKASQINPFVTLWWAVTGLALNGNRVLSDTITREEALIAHTRWNAYLMFQESNIGSIRPGLIADLLVLDRDYLTVPDSEIKEISPLATMVGGKVVYGEL